MFSEEIEKHWRAENWLMETEYHIADLFQLSPFLHEEDIPRTVWVKRLYLIMLNCVSLQT